MTQTPRRSPTSGAHNHSQLCVQARVDSPINHLDTGFSVTDRLTARAATAGP
jgi:hypothetical protein